MEKEELLNKTDKLKRFVERVLKRTLPQYQVSVMRHILAGKRIVFCRPRKPSEYRGDEVKCTIIDDPLGKPLTETQKKEYMTMFDGWTRLAKNGSTIIDATAMPVKKTHLLEALLPGKESEDAE